MNFLWKPPSWVFSDLRLKKKGKITWFENEIRVLREFVEKITKFPIMTSFREFRPSSKFQISLDSTSRAVGKYEITCENNTKRTNRPRRLLLRLISHLCQPHRNAGGIEPSVKCWVKTGYRAVNRKFTTLKNDAIFKVKISRTGEKLFTVRKWSTLRPIK